MTDHKDRSRTLKLLLKWKKIYDLVNKYNPEILCVLSLHCGVRSERREERCN